MSEAQEQIEAIVGRVPPASVETERSVLAALMVIPEAWDEASARLRAEDFFSPKHRLIFEALCRLSDGGHPLDSLSVHDHLEQRQLSTASGGLAYLTELTLSELPTLSLLTRLVDILVDRSLLRSVIQAAEVARDEAFSPKELDADDVLARAEERFARMAEGRQFQEEGATPESLAPRLIDKLEALSTNKGSLAGLTTGFDKLDEMTTGLQKGDLVIVAGRPSMGKTTFAMNLIENALLAPEQSPGAAVVFSLEMPSEQLYQRMVSSLGRIDAGAMRKGELSADQLNQVAVAINRLKGKPLVVYDQPGMTPAQLRACVRQQKRKHGKVDIIMVDYLQLMSPNEKSESHVNDISSISRNLKAIAREFNCPLVALSQLNRGLEQRPNKRPINSDLRESGAIEQDADIIMFVYRDEVYYPEKEESHGRAEIIIGKQRNGPIGTCHLAFQGRYTRFDNLAPEHFSDAYPDA